MAYLDMNESGSPAAKPASDPTLSSEEKKDLKMVMDMYAKGKAVRKEYDKKWDEYFKF